MALVAAGCAGGPEGSPAATPVGRPAGASPSLERCRPDRGAAPAPTAVWHRLEATHAAFLRDLAGRRFAGPLVFVAFDSDDALRDALAASPTADLPAVVLAPDTMLAELAESGRFVPAGPCLDRLGVRTPPPVPVVARTWTLDTVRWAQPIEIATLLTFVNDATRRRWGLARPLRHDDLLSPAPELGAAGGTPGTPAWSADGDLCTLVTRQWPAQRARPIVEAGPGGTLVTHFDEPAFRRDLDGLRARGQGAVTGTNTGSLLSRSLAGDQPFVLASSLGLLFGRQLVATGQLRTDAIEVLPPPPVDGAAGVLVRGYAAWLAPRDEGLHPRAGAFVGVLADPATQAEIAAGAGFAPATAGALADPALQDTWRRYPQLRVTHDAVSSTPDEERFAGLKSPLRRDVERVLGRVCDAAMAGLAYDDELDRARTELDQLVAARRALGR